MDVVWLLLKILVAILVVRRFCKDFFAIGDWRKALRGTATGILLLVGMDMFL